MQSDTISVYQRNWAFTSSDSPKPKIQTSGFGPCYVVTFTSGKFAAMAHIDDITLVDSMTSIFNKFTENSVNLKDVKVIVLGGWETHSESYKWGTKIVRKINESGFENVSTKNMFLKKSTNIFQQIHGISSRSEAVKHYHLGAIVNSLNGKTFILNEFSRVIEDEQTKQTNMFAHPSDLSIEIPLTQVTG